MGATELRKQGIMKSASESQKGYWELNSSDADG